MRKMTIVYSGLTFGQALQCLQQGNLVRRAGWNGKEMFLFLRPTVSAKVDLVYTLPERVRQYFKEKGRATAQFTSYICMKAADDSIVNGWLASQTDMLADDWEMIA